MTIASRTRAERDRKPGEEVLTTDRYGDGKVRFFLRPEADGGTLIVNGTRSLGLNATAALIVRRLLSADSPAAIVRRILKERRALKHLVERDVEAIQTLLLRLAAGQRETDDLGPAVTGRVAPLQRHVSAPARADLEIGPDPGSSAGERPPLDATAWSELIDRLASAGIPHLCFTGGEPLLRSEILDILPRARRRGCLVGLATAGDRLKSPDRSSKLASVVDYVQVDVPTLDTIGHQAWGGKGTAPLADVRAGLRSARAHGIRTILHVPLLQSNRGELPAIARWAKDQGVDRIAFSVPFDSDESPPDLEAALLDLKEAATREGLPLVPHPVVRITPRLRPLITGRRTEAFSDLSFGTTEWGAARVSMWVLPDGRATPGAFFREPVGDVPSIPWALIWNHSICRDIRSKKVERKRWEQFAAADVYPWPLYPGI